MDVHTYIFYSTLIHPSLTKRTPSQLQATIVYSRSILHKNPLIISLVTDFSLNIIFNTEISLSPSDSPSLSALNSPSYLFRHYRPDSIHTGISIDILYKFTLTITNITKHILKYIHSESLSYDISSKFFRTFNVTLFYRPPSNTMIPFPNKHIIFLTKISSNTILLGDFNMPFIPQGGYLWLIF